MKDWSELLTAIAALLWPIFTFTALLLFKDQIRDLISRLKKGKLLGQEFELRDTLGELKDQANEAKEVVLKLPQTSQTTVIESENNSGLDDVTKRVLDEAAKSPKIGLILLATELEKEIRYTLGSLSLLKKNSVNLKQGVELLAKAKGLPKEIINSTNLFLSVRNRLVHGFDSKPDEIFSAIDSGLTILRALKSLPRVSATVRGTDVELYEDKTGKNIRTDIKGLLIEAEQLNGNNPAKILRVVPTRGNRYVVGEIVSWEWDFDQVVDESFYKDQTTGEIKLAWSQSATFIGRSLDDL